jgi:hypothetical protein
MNELSITRNSRGATVGMKRVLVVVSAALLVAMLPGCDKAKSSYKRCVIIEAQGDVDVAAEACREAVSLSPNSKSGKAAAEKLKALEAKISQAKADKGYPDKDPPCKGKKWVTRCKWKGEKRPNPLEAQTKARCNQDAYELVAGVGMECPTCVCIDDFEKTDGGEGE